CQQVYSPAFSF
nr:immunoglobulin light chain junction region [Macaca mulatta]